jgi:holo-[acyl-carrier protein] synthase
LVIGIGVDLVSVERISRIHVKYRDRFLNRIFTPAEKTEFYKRGAQPASLAARFAAKEAALKAIGCGIGPAALNEVEVVARPGRQPFIRLHGAASRLAKEKKIKTVLLSMAHEPPLACAFATATG